MDKNDILNNNYIKTLKDYINELERKQKKEKEHIEIEDIGEEDVANE